MLYIKVIIRFIYRVHQQSLRGACHPPVQGGDSHTLKRDALLNTTFPTVNRLTRAGCVAAVSWNDTVTHRHLIPHSHTRTSHYRLECHTPTDGVSDAQRCLPVARLTTPYRPTLPVDK